MSSHQILITSNYTGSQLTVFGVVERDGRTVALLDLDLQFGDAKLNYGCDSVRFTNPVPVGSRVRATATFEGVKQLEKGVQITTKYVVEIEGVERPALVAQQITLVLG